MRYIVAIFLLLFATSAQAVEIYNHDFNDNTFGGLGTQSGTQWSVSPTGGMGGSPAAVCDYTVNGSDRTAPFQLGLSLDAYSTDEVWIEFDTKITGVMNGGMKGVKLFGHAPEFNNMTLLHEYASNTQSKVLYFSDTLCETQYRNGYTPDPSCSDRQVDARVTGGAIDFRGGSWGHYKVYIKRSDVGVDNGVLKVWWNGELKVHFEAMATNPGTGDSNGFDRMTFGDFTTNTTSGTTWYYWIDNVYVGTTEKDGVTTPIDGDCGTADGVSVSSTPTSGLCNEGSAGTVSLNGSNYEWDCNGYNGGSTDSCTAPYVAPSSDGGVFSWSSATYTADRADGYAYLTINRTGTDGAVTVDWGTLSDTATTGVDYYGAADQEVAFADGEASKQIQIQLYDNAAEDDRDFDVVFMEHSPTTVIGTPSTTRVTILGETQVDPPDDPPATGSGSIVEVAGLGSWTEVAGLGSWTEAGAGLSGYLRLDSALLPLDSELLQQD